MIDSLREHLSTDWAALTFIDWFGLLVVVILATLMFVLYVYVFSPGNKEKLESYRDFVLKDDLTDGENNHGRK
ncbi:MAG: cbb3-type cytochrome c oxidase subunit 3 [Gammaproteobacteria bacterium]|nr:cbb3-type cytochrome c oxidase subunit 3 [Gammaproteobacteria bacterium]MCF6229454.1 cbb3-type cytochrome c oxidase subunit 3 [Gammaproteobacteria bacterium]